MAEYVAPVLQQKMANIFPIAQKLLEMDKDVKITVTGGSMYPFLRDGVDSVILAGAVSYQPKRNDIVLVIRKNGQFVLHRIVKVRKNAVYILGDAQKHIEGPFMREDIVAVVRSVCRNGTIIDTSCFSWQALSCLWRFLRPARVRLISWTIKLRSFKRAFF